LWYVAAALSGLGLAGLYSARTTHFIHGEELSWFLAYLGPLALSAISFFLASVHVARGRFRSPIAWIPVVISLLLSTWLVAYLFFDRFRTP